MKTKKEEIYNFLKENKISFNQKEIKRKTGITIPTLIKWIPILERESKITVNKYSNVKMVKAI